MRFPVLVALLCLALPAAALANATPRIVGGKKAKISDYPFQVALVSTDTSTAPASNTYQHQFCGGSILDATHVITAAHCLYDTVAPGQAAPPHSLEVLAGTGALVESDPQPAGQQRIAVVATSFNPQYDPNATDHDAAILTLATPISFGIAEPIAILGDESLAAAGGLVDVSGWGSTVQQDPGFSNTPSYPLDLQAVTTQVVDQSECDSDYGGGITGRMICAGAANQDACQGDSGGPLVADADPTPSTIDWQLVGIVSTGDGCGWPGFPGIYTRAFEPSIESFLTSDPPQAPVQSGAVTLTGTPEPGQTLTCDPGAWDGDPTFTYSFGGAAGSSPDYVVTSADAGRTIACTVQARNAGGFGSATSAGLSVPAAPAQTTTTTDSTPPPPPQDTTAPTATLRYARCRGTKCVLNVEVTDPPYTAGLGKVSVKAKVVEQVRCRRAADRRRGRVCTRTRVRTAKVSRLGGTVFAAVLRKARPGAYSFTIVASDAAGNRQIRPLHKRLKLTRTRR
jgi:secreted trypsin-like serine protease